MTHNCLSYFQDDTLSAIPGAISPRLVALGLNGNNMCKHQVFEGYDHIWKTLSVCNKRGGLPVYYMEYLTINGPSLFISQVFQYQPKISYRKIYIT